MHNDEAEWQLNEWKQLSRIQQSLVQRWQCNLDRLQNDDNIKSSISNDDETEESDDEIEEGDDESANSRNGHERSNAVEASNDEKGSREIRPRRERVDDCSISEDFLYGSIFQSSILIFIEVTRKFNFESLI